jgi:hypothetical protein
MVVDKRALLPKQNQANTSMFIQLFQLNFVLISEFLIRSGGDQHCLAFTHISIWHLSLGMMKSNETNAFL